jgi:hypothetical protein
MPLEAGSSARHASRHVQATDAHFPLEAGKPSHGINTFLTHEPANSGETASHVHVTERLRFAEQNTTLQIT